jgi:ketosteroid isomerase-like protein
MSRQDVENARRGYAILNEAYRADDARLIRPLLEEQWRPDAVLVPAGVLPESAPARGWDGIVQFMAEQMTAFQPRSRWIEPDEYIDTGDRLIVPYRFGGRARHTELDVEFAFVHVFTIRAGKTTRLDVHQSKAEAFEAAGVVRPPEPGAPA